MKKSMIALLCCLLGLLILTTAAAETSDCLFDAATGSITGWTGKETIAEIPAEIGGIPVTAVAPLAFSGCAELETVYFPASIERIGEKAFLDCYSLTYLIFEASSLPYVDPTAFTGCPLTDVDIAWNATREATDAAQSLFNDMGFNAKVWRANAPELETPADGYVYEKTGGGAKYALTTYTGTQTALYPHYNLIFENGDAAPVVALGNGVFSDHKQLKKFAVPHSDRFTTIGNEAFANSGLEWIDLYDTVTEIGRGAFRDCIDLKSLTLTPSIRTIGTDAFAGCTGLTDLYIGCDGSVLPRNAFADCSSLTAVTIATKSVPGKLFANLPITSVALGDSLEKIGEEAFRGTSVTELVLPESVRNVGSKAFDDCRQLESVTILCDADALPPDAFKGCTNLKSITIRKGSIPDNFLKDSTIETLVLGEEVTSIGKNAFANTAVTNVVLPAEAEVSQNAFSGVPYEEIRIADDAEDRHIDALSKAMNRPWYYPLQRVSDPPALQPMPEIKTDEGNFLFLKETGTIIGYTGDDAMVAVPKQIGGVDVKTIDTLGDYPSTGMLRTLLIPESVTGIGANAFTNCTNLETFLCYGPLDILGEGAFRNCTALKTAIFANGIYQIDAYAFDGCTDLKELWWKGSANRIGEGALQSTALENFALPVSRIDREAFRDCHFLRQVHIRNCIQRIDTNVFEGCNALEVLCFETADSSIFRQSARIGTITTVPTVIIPAGSSLKELQSMFKVVSTGNYGPITKREEILLADCTLPELPVPDIDSIVSDLSE